MWRDIAKKARKEITSRTDIVGEDERAEATFVFVTPWHYDNPRKNLRISFWNWPREEGGPRSASLMEHKSSIGWGRLPAWRPVGNALRCNTFRRGSGAHHVHRTGGLGASVLIRESWYKCVSRLLQILPLQ